jgi:dephospho-CoA kinase
MDPDRFDAVVLVDAPVATRRDRIVSTRGLDPAAADAMIRSQLPAESKRRRSTFVIDNDADLETLERRARAVWDRLVALAERRGDG